MQEQPWIHSTETCSQACYCDRSVSNIVMYSHYVISIVLAGLCLINEVVSTGGDIISRQFPLRSGYTLNRQNTEHISITGIRSKVRCLHR